MDKPTDSGISLPLHDDAAARWVQYERRYVVQAVKVLADLLTETLPASPPLTLTEWCAAERAVLTLLTNMLTSTVLAWAANVDGVPWFEGWKE